MTPRRYYLLNAFVWIAAIAMLLAMLSVLPFLKGAFWYVFGHGDPPSLAFPIESPLTNTCQSEDLLPGFPRCGFH